MDPLTSRPAPATATLARFEPAVWAAVAVLSGVVVGWQVAHGAPAAAVLLLCAAVVMAVLTFRRLEFGLLALMFTLPLDTYGRIIETPVTVTTFHVALVVCLAAWVRQMVRSGTRPRLTWVDAGALALVAAGLWSLPTSLSPSATVLAVVRVAFLWTLAFLYENAVDDERRLRRVLAALAITGVITGVIGIAQYAVPGFDLGSIRDVLRAGHAVAFSRAGAFFYDPNYFAGFLSAVVAVSLAFVAHARTRRAALLWGAAAAVTGVALVVTFSRGGWVAGAAGVLAVAFTAPKRRRVWMLGALVVAALAAVIVAPDTVVSRVQSFSSVETDVSIATRVYMAQSMQQMIADRPVFGTGLGAFDKAYPFYRRPGSSFDIVRPHQIPMAFVAETGVAGLLAELLLAAAVIGVYWRRRPEGWDVLEAAVLVGLVALLVGTLFEYYLYFEYLWLFLGLSPVAVRLARGHIRRDPVEL